MRRGFTLFELLAIIVIISTFALITTPLVYIIITNSDKKVFEYSCNEVYNSYEQYEINEETWKKDFCTIFEFNSNRNNTEILENTIYEPVSKLNIKGDIPKSGLYKVCDREKSLIIDNGKYTCVKTNNKDAIILDGTINDNDIINPEIDVITSSTTNSITIIVKSINNSVIIDKYYYKLDGEELSSKSNVMVYNNLEKDKEYTIEVVAESITGLKSNKVQKKVTTVKINNPRFSEVQSPINTKYAINKLVTIKYDVGSEYSYYFKSSVDAESVIGNLKVCKQDSNGNVLFENCINDNTNVIKANTWYKTDILNQQILYRQNGNLYAVTSDKINDFVSSNYKIERIDTTEPIVNISLNDIKTDRVTLVAICSDSESGITKYEYSKDNGATWINKTINNHTFTGLELKDKETLQNIKYEFKVRCTNGSGLTRENGLSSSLLELTDPSIEQKSKTPSSGKWATSKIIQITYNNKNVENPMYYFKSSVRATVDSGIVNGVCGTGINPGSCTDSSITTLEANTWYRTSNQTPMMTYEDNGTLYALISDGINTRTSTFTISKISTGTPTAPIITGGSDIWSNTSKTISVSEASTETSGIKKYQYYISDSNSTELNENSWIDLPKKELLVVNDEVVIDINGTNYIYFRAVANNGNVSKASNYEITKIDTVAPSTPKLVLKLENENGDIYNSGTWTNKSVYHMVKSTDDNSKIVKYQYSHDGKNWSDEINNPNWSPNYSEDRNYFTYKITWEVNNQFYIRSIDNAGNISDPSDSFRVQIDTTQPSVPKVEYKTGYNIRAYQQEFEIELSSDAKSGIAYYESDGNGDGIPDFSTEHIHVTNGIGNFVPWPNFTSGTQRFRAISNSGVASEWTDIYRIYQKNLTEPLIKNGNYIITASKIGSDNKVYVLDINMNNNNQFESGQNVALWEQNNQNNQIFKIEYNSDGGYYRIFTLDNNYSLDVNGAEDVNGAAFTNGTNIQIYEKNDSPAQKFKILEAVDGGYFIMTSNSNYFVDYNGGNAQAGTNVDIWEYNESDNSSASSALRWNFIEINSYTAIKTLDTVTITEDAIESRPCVDLPGYYCSATEKYPEECVTPYQKCRNGDDPDRKAPYNDKNNLCYCRRWGDNLTYYCAEKEGFPTPEPTDEDHKCIYSQKKDVYSCPYGGELDETTKKCVNLK